MRNRARQFVTSRGRIQSSPERKLTHLQHLQYTWILLQLNLPLHDDLHLSAPGYSGPNSACKVRRVRKTLTRNSMDLKVSTSNLSVSWSTSSSLDVTFPVIRPCSSPCSRVMRNLTPIAFKLNNLDWNFHRITRTDLSDGIEDQIPIHPNPYLFQRSRVLIHGVTDMDPTMKYLETGADLISDLSESG